MVTPLVRAMLHSKLPDIAEEDVREAIDEYLAQYPDDARHLKCIALCAYAHVDARMAEAKRGSKNTRI